LQQLNKQYKTEKGIAVKGICAWYVVCRYIDSAMFHRSPLLQSAIVNLFNGHSGKLLLPPPPPLSIAVIHLPIVALSFWLWVKVLMELRDELTGVGAAMTRVPIPAPVTDDRFALLLPWLLLVRGSFTEEGVDRVEAVSSSVPSDSSLPHELDDSISTSGSELLRPSRIREERPREERALRSFLSAVGGRKLNLKTGRSLLLALMLVPWPPLGHEVLARHNMAENAICRKDLCDLRAGYCC